MPPAGRLALLLGVSLTPPAVRFSREACALSTFARANFDGQMFDWPRLNKLVAWRLLGLVEPNAGNHPCAQTGPWRSGSSIKSSGPPCQGWRSSSTSRLQPWPSSAPPSWPPCGSSSRGTETEPRWSPGQRRAATRGGKRMTEIVAFEGEMTRRKSSAYWKREK